MRSETTSVVARRFENVGQYGLWGDDFTTLRGRRQVSEQVNANSQRTILTSDEFAFSLFEVDEIRQLAIGNPGSGSPSGQGHEETTFGSGRLANVHVADTGMLLIVAAGGLDPDFESESPDVFNQING